MSVFVGLYKTKMRDHVFGTPADHLVDQSELYPKLDVLRESGGFNRCST